MNRERLKTLRDHLAGLPDERVDMSTGGREALCGTVACIGGWAEQIFGGEYWNDVLDLSDEQGRALFYPAGWFRRADDPNRLTRTDAIAAIDSMMANPDDKALPVWPEKAVSE